MSSHSVDTVRCKPNYTLVWNECLFGGVAKTSFRAHAIALLGVDPVCYRQALAPMSLCSVDVLRTAVCPFGKVVKTSFGAHVSTFRGYRAIQTELLMGLEECLFGGVVKTSFRAHVIAFRGRLSDRRGGFSREPILDSAKNKL